LRLLRDYSRKYGVYEVTTAVFGDYSMLVTFYEMSEMTFHVILTKGFHMKAEGLGFMGAGSSCLQKLKFENNSHLHAECSTTVVYLFLLFACFVL